MRYRLAVWVAAVSLAAVSCSTGTEAPVSSSTTFPVTQPATTRATTPPASTSTFPTTVPERRVPRITVNADRFVVADTAEPFVPVGVDYFNIVPIAGGFEDRVFSPAIFDEAQVTADFTRLADAGYTTVRMFMDSCGSGDACIGSSTGRGLNPEYLAVIAEVTSIARQQGLYLVLTSNDLPDQGGYWEQSNKGASGQFAGYRNAHYLTAPGVVTAVRYWDDLMGGLEDADAAFDAVLAWSILNEQWFFADQPPLSLTSGVVTTANGRSYDLSDPEQRRAMTTDGIRYYIDQVASVIRGHDPDGLVTMGFFTPQFPNATAIGGDWYVDTAPLLADSALDFFDFHAYPGGDLDLGKMAENFGMVGYTARPIIMGEFGAFIDRYPKLDVAAWTLQTWVADSCDLGFDGWLHWAYVQAPRAIGDTTWGLVDEDGLLLDALSPARRDPCSPADVRTANVAFHAPVRASRSLPAEPPEAAVDGGPAQWGSGADAPQWIEVAFPDGIDVGSVVLTVAQWPAGRTVHEITAMLVSGKTVSLHRFDGPTADGDVLEYRLPEPVTDVVAVRVATTLSPSWVAWREIEIYGPDDGD